MAKVTKIQQQVKRSDRYSIYIDEAYSFSLSEHQLVGSGLRVGKEFTAEELATFKSESAFGKAYERTLNYVAIRPRSRKEIHDYLVRTFLYPKPKVYTDRNGQQKIKKIVVDKTEVQQMIERVMQRLETKGYIDDQAFANAWLASRQLTKPSSRRRLKQELKAKGISTEIIATSLQNENIDEASNLEQLITKKQRQSRYRDPTKLTHYLLRQGFNYDQIKSKLNKNQ